MRLGAAECFTLLFVVLLVAGSGWVMAGLLRASRMRGSRCSACRALVPAGAVYCPACGRHV